MVYTTLRWRTQDLAPILGSVYVSIGWRANAGAMKLMGVPRLFQGADGLSRVAVRACAALRMELEIGAWRSRDDVAAAFPLASWEVDRLVVALDEHACAVIVFNYGAGVALIEFAGSRLERDARQRRRERR
jgi:hypothetical protein